MAKIDVYTTQISDLAAKLRKTEQSLADAQQLVASAQAELSMEVASREGINGQMAAAKKKITTQNNKVEQMASLCIFVADEFSDADRKGAEKAKSFFSNILSSLGKVAGAVGRFIASIGFQRHAETAGVFLTSGSLLSGVALASLVNSLHGGSGLGHSSGNGGHNGATTTTTTTQKPETTQPSGAEEKPETTQPSGTEQKPHVTTEAEKQKELKEINDRYNRLPNSISKKGFEHKCGALVFQQLNEMGVVVSGESAGDYARDYAKKLAKKGITATGYTCKGYEGNDAFNKLLEANKGKFPITNIVCSYNQGGNFPNSAGHAMLITKIDENGNVYFVDNTKASNYKAVCMTIKEFKAFYFKSTNKCNGITHLYK